MEKSELTTEHYQLVTQQAKEMTVLHREVEELRSEVKQLREDIESIDLFQKKPVVTAEIIGVVGFYIIAALVIIGIFF